MDFNVLWEQIQPWVALAVQIVALLSGGTVTVALVKKAVLTLLSKRSNELTNYDLVSAISDKVVKGIGKKSINIDIKTLLESEARKIASEVATEMRSEFKDMMLSLSSDMKDVKTASVGVADLLVRGREMSDKQKAELLATVVSARGALPEEPKEPIVIELDDTAPVVEAVKPVPVVEVKPKNAISFG